MEKKTNGYKRTGEGERKTNKTLLNTENEDFKRFNAIFADDLKTFNAIL